ncbi:MAG TPA: hypothetical protein V6C81_12225 [Planktothrix sp.]|jgi:hypothetical protein
METVIDARTSDVLNNESFDKMVVALQAHFTQTLERNGKHLFEVSTAADLYEIYLSHLPSDRGYHTCSCCKQFITRYGSLASVNEDGSLTAALWTGENVPEFYHAAVLAVAKAVQRGRITGVALTQEEVWGTPERGGWTHFAITAPKQIVFPATRALTAGQAAAAKLEDHGTLLRGLAEYNRDTVAQALTFLEADSLYSGEKVIGPARFLLELHDIKAAHRGRPQENLIWLRVAGAPVGFCQPRSTMIGTLLDDIKDGYDFDDIKRRFSSKMHPLLYQRPQAAPTAGNIRQAEQLVEKLGLESSLHRRYARLEEIPTIWAPRAVNASKAPAQPSVFAHLQAKGTQQAHTAPVSMTPKTITWRKFAETVLPNALKMEVYLEGDMNLCGILTAVNAEAPPIIQWDLPEERNPFSWYVYNDGSPAERWGLTNRTWAKVAAVTLQPSMWSSKSFEHQGESAILVLEGAREQGNPSRGLFPGILKSDLHAVRSTIEAHSKSGHPQGASEGSANGLRVGQPDTKNTIRVTTAIGVAMYHIDRWD